ncbi:MAG TPA: hypothetical protein VLK82_25565 [Candidatus Tectomicrobia bacterium]|nr:hypothetical protein [Candidatus Tectomicrobia bacterium]
MNILERRHTWLHTHFLTDCERLPPHRMREIESQIVPVLRNLRIVYDIHFDAHRDDPGVRIVLECIPLPNTLELIELELKRIVEPIPARPREMHIVTFDRPPAGGNAGATTPGSATVTPDAGREE